MTTNDKRERIKNLILSHRGKDNAIKASKLAKLTNIKETHQTCPEVRRIINFLRKTGFPIGSCSEGYFFINNDKDFGDFTDRIIQNIQSQVSNLNVVRETYNQLTR